MWTLLDGTSAWAPPGRLVRDDSGRVRCHLCGRWFDHLGAHLRRHGWTAAQYRTAVGLAAGRALCSSEISHSIADRGGSAWHTQTGLHEAFDDGRRAGVAVMTGNARGRRSALEVAECAARNLQVARTRREKHHEAELRRRACADGFTDIGAMLRHRYEQGASLAELQRLTGRSRQHVRARLTAAGAVIRSPGQTPLTAGNRRGQSHDHVATRMITDAVNT